MSTQLNQILDRLMQRITLHLGSMSLQKNVAVRSEIKDAMVEYACKHENTMFVERDGDYHDMHRFLDCGKLICVKL